jgi:toxin ParE1/3/4
VSFGYQVRPLADRDIDTIADNLADHASLAIGLRFLQEVYEAFALLATQPEMGWPCKINHKFLKKARTFRVSERFSEYLIFYQPCEDRIEIIRVVHGAQDLQSLFNKADVS